ncbi:hypothetical protein [Hyphomonas sp.]|jgi:hypothetical protein|uniref:hypothetical protein n=1 Tax=Hyphomonas sp. TaxID=87 RepID=UPI0025C1FDC5|nr:hypothetical protein [Hyphomonas sp.]
MSIAATGTHGKAKAASRQAPSRLEPLFVAAAVIVRTPRFAHFSLSASARKRHA